MIFSGIHAIPYDKALAEHVFLLRCEGLTRKAIGLRVGCNHERVRSLERQFIRRLNKAMSRTRAYVTVTTPESR